MFKLIDPELWHVLFAGVGALLGWWLRLRNEGPGLPPEVAEVVKLILEKRKQQQTQSQLDDLLTALRQEKGQAGS